MLILSRRPGEALFLTDGARRSKVVILGLKGTQVKIGIDAPMEVSVDREELLARAEGAGRRAPQVRYLPHVTDRTLPLRANADEIEDLSNDEVLALLG